MVDESDLLITICEEQADSEARSVFKEECPLAEFLAAIARCISTNPALQSNERIDQLYEQLLPVK